MNDGWIHVLAFWSGIIYGSLLYWWFSKDKNKASYEHVLIYEVSTNKMQDGEIPDEFIQRAFKEGLGKLKIK